MHINSTETANLHCRPTSSVEESDAARARLLVVLQLLHFPPAAARSGERQLQPVTHSLLR